MKKITSLTACFCGAIMAASASGCIFGKSTLLAKPVSVKALSYEETYSASFKSFQQKANAFSAKFSDAVYQSQSQDKNFTLSPISVFFALSLASECANGNTRAQLLSALDVSYDELSGNVGKLYRSLQKTYETENVLGRHKTTGQLSLTNSVWIDKQATAKKDCLDILSQNYYCYAYSADFFNDNASANRAVREFVKKQTKKKIDRDFQLSNQTLFTLINTLYLKDIWNEDGDELPKTQPYTFTNADGSTSSEKLLQGYYKPGRMQQAEGYSFFYTTTYHGYTVHFILPDDGYSIKDVFTEESLNIIKAATDYNAVDEEKRIHYFTRCLFPAYKADFYKDIRPVLQEAFGISDLFSVDDCDFSTLTNDSVVCDQVVHSATLEVDARGIEGAAVTVMEMNGTAAPEPYEIVYEDFLVNKAFGFVLSDSLDTTLFSGVVHTI